MLIKIKIKVTFTIENIFKNKNMGPFVNKFYSSFHFKRKKKVLSERKLKNKLYVKLFGCHNPPTQVFSLTYAGIIIINCRMIRSLGQVCSECQIMKNFINALQ